jgi:hypothetical protein
VVKVVLGHRERALAAIEAHPRNQPLVTGAATIIVLAETGNAFNGRFFGGSAFVGLASDGAEGMDWLLTLSSIDCMVAAGSPRATWVGDVTLPQIHPAIGKPLGALLQATSAKIRFEPMPQGTAVVGGFVSVALNGSFRFQLDVPAQTLTDRFIVLNDLTPLHDLLK